jgi:hypothetical protein
MSAWGRWYRPFVAQSGQHDAGREGWLFSPIISKADIAPSAEPERLAALLRRMVEPVAGPNGKDSSETAFRVGANVRVS